MTEIAFFLHRLKIKCVENLTEIEFCRFCREVRLLFVIFKHCDNKTSKVLFVGESCCFAAAALTARYNISA